MLLYSAATNTGGGTGGALAGREQEEGAECEIIRDRDEEDTRLLPLPLLTLSVLLLRGEELQARAGG